MASVNYDRIADAYCARYRANPEGSPALQKRIDRLMEQCPDPSSCVAAPAMLDLGCGNGHPFLKEFADCGYKTIGVDTSERMIELASDNVPAAKLLCKPMQRCNFAEASIDVVVANRSLLHVPRRMHAEMFAKIREWLVGGGRFLLGGLDGENKGSAKKWLGDDVYESYYDLETTKTMLTDAGFLFDYIEHEDDFGEHGWWIQAYA